MSKPSHYFKSLGVPMDITELESVLQEPEVIEYLKISTGETFRHSEGTAYWDHKHNKMDILGMKKSGITHWRIWKMPPVESVAKKSQPAQKQEKPKLHTKDLFND
jgi:hypothetical protein